MTNFAIGVIASLVAAAIIVAVGVVWHGKASGGPSLGAALGLANRMAFVEGVRLFYPDRASLIRKRGSVSQYVLTCQHDVSYVGLWLSSSIEQGDLIEGIRKLAQSERRFEAALLDPRNDALLPFCAKSFGLTVEELRNRITATLNKLHDLRASLPEECRKNVVLRVHTRALTESAFIIDRNSNGCHLLVDHKLDGAARTDSYGVEISGTSPLGERFKRSFAAILDSSEEFRNP